MENSDTPVETKYQNIHKLLREEHYDTWVAFSPDYARVVAYDDNLRKLDERVGGEYVVYLRTLPKGVAFVPTTFAQ